jgi:hypothetical protein
MPLRDYFRAPVMNFASWEELYGAWPATIAFRLNALLPPEYRSGVKVYLGNLVEVDVGTFEVANAGAAGNGAPAGSGPDAAPAWQAAAPTLLLETEELTPPEYEVRVYSLADSRRLVAAFEIVSPRNKDRTEARDAFVSKCHAMLLEQVCVVIVDPVTTRPANLFAELAQRLGARPPSVADEPIYAVSCRVRGVPSGQRVETWEHALAVGAALPTLPLWISESQYVPLELERTYEDTCRGLRIP